MGSAAVIAAAGALQLAILILIERRLPIGERWVIVAVWMAAFVTGTFRSAVADVTLAETLRMLALFYFWVSIATGFRPAIATAASLALYDSDEDPDRFTPQGAYEKIVSKLGPWLIILGVGVFVVVDDVVFSIR